MHYSESISLYVDFMLDKLSRDSFLECVALLDEEERDKLFGMNKMQIFRKIYEDTLAKNNASSEIS